MTTENLQTDIVIVGGGGAGMAAALTAIEKGCSNVIVVEKSGSPGGNSAMAHDIFAAESPVQIRMGTDARRDHFFEVAMQWSHWSKVNPRIVRAFIDKSGDTIGWLLEKGLNFELGQFYINQSPRIRHVIEGKGAELMRVLTNICREKGVKIITNARGNKIIRGKDGRVTGIEAKSKDTDYVINAKSVIMTTGGYAGNKEMLQKYCSYYQPDAVDNTGVPSNTGDGILMAIDAGAATAGLGHLMFRGPMPSTKKYRLMETEDGYKVGMVNLVWEPQIMWVNKKGKRFVDEGFNLSSFAHGNVVAQQPGGIMYALYDDSILQSMEEQGFIRTGAYGGHQMDNIKRLPSGMPTPGLRKALLEKADAEKDINLKISDSLDEIAQWIGAKPEILKASVTEYNEYCKNGLDPFCKDRRWLLPLQKPPYYAIKGQANLGDALGGFKINEHMEVLDTEDEPIPGLFAAGSTAGCWESESYCYELTGHLLGFAINSGRIAGGNASNRVLK